MSKLSGSATPSPRRSSRFAFLARVSAPVPSQDSSDPDGEADAVVNDMWLAARATKKKAKPEAVAARVPWVKRGIDYGAARAGFKDLATWALDLVEHEVADVPADCKRVRNVRRAILGTSGRAPSAADARFTAEILARVLDRDLDLDLGDQLAIFEQLELPIEFLAMWSPAPRASTPLDGRAPSRIPPVSEPPSSTPPAPPPLRFCDDCACVHEPGDHLRHYRIAA